MHPPAPSLVLFAPERGDARVAKRVRMLQDHGWQVTVFSFHRQRSENHHPSPWPFVDLGETRDRAYAHRLAAITRALGPVWRHRTALASADAVYAINTDNAVLALAGRIFARHKVPLFLEIADLQPPFTRDRMTSRLLRWVERRVLDRVACLVTTSPAFVREYFSPIQQYTGRLLILENKVYPSTNLAPPPPPPAGPPWRIGWFGALRCLTSWNAIVTLAKLHPESLQFVIRGYPTAIDTDTFRSQAAQSPAISFDGPFTYPDDLPALHHGLHFSWGFDFSDPTANSRWLLPNRLYESSLCHVPMIAAADTETGRRLTAAGTGPALAVTPTTLTQTLSTFFSSLTAEAWHAWHTALAAQPPDHCRGEADAHSLHDMLQIHRIKSSSG